ncbi:hypothetical protein [Burkholderia cenocepacia]|uniref:hypothetical protein n=1 Tax=Burkholderia cenocepacia TaxID=95486 RepID=UPI0038CC1BAD
MLEAITAAHTLYEQRNRVVHDAFRRDRLSEQRRWERVRLTQPRTKGEDPSFPSTTVSIEELVNLVFALTHTTWRLRGALWTMMSTYLELSPYLTHSFEPQ